MFLILGDGLDMATMHLKINKITFVVVEIILKWLVITSRWSRSLLKNGLGECKSDNKDSYYIR